MTLEKLIMLSLWSGCFPTLKLKSVLLSSVLKTAACRSIFKFYLKKREKKPPDKTCLQQMMIPPICFTADPLYHSKKKTGKLGEKKTKLVVLILKTMGRIVKSSFLYGLEYCWSRKKKSQWYNFLSFTSTQKRLSRLLLLSFRSSFWALCLSICHLQHCENQNIQYAQHVYFAFTVCESEKTHHSSDFLRTMETMAFLLFLCDFLNP